MYPIPASDFLLEIDGIKGESADKKHKDTIEVSSGVLVIEENVPSAAQEGSS